jgi:hypothetical protein
VTPAPDDDRLIRAFLDDGLTELPDRAYEAVRAEIDRTPQRTSIGSWRGLVTITPEKLAVGAVAVVVVVVLGVATFLDTFGHRGISADPGATMERASAAAVIAAAPVLPESARLDPGTYRLRQPFPVSVAVSVPAGWTACVMGDFEQAVCEEEISVSFMVIESVVTDPCDPVQRLDPAVGPSVDDLVAAIIGLDGFAATPPTDITIDGFAGKQFMVSAPSGTTCDLRTWGNADRVNGVGPGEVNVLRIVDVDGQRILMAAAYFPGQTSESRRAMEAHVLDTVRIAP